MRNFSTLLREMRGTCTKKTGF